MKIFSTSGTAGDSYICALQLCDLAKEEDEIHVNHFCEVDSMDDLCIQIFKYFNISCHIVKQRDMDNVRIHSDVVNGLPCGINPFPKVDFHTISRNIFGISFDTYNCIQLRSGKETENRVIPLKAMIPNIISWIKNNEIRTCLIGGFRVTEEESDDVDMLKRKHRLVNAAAQCHIFESFDIIKHCNELYAHQGLLVYYALSQKIPCHVFYKNPWEKEAFERRCLPEWKEFVKEITQI